MSVIHPILESEETLTLAQAAARLPRIGGKVRSTESVCAWVTRGIRVGSRVVKLEAVRVGRQWHTSAEAIGRFLAATSPTATRPVEPPSVTRARAASQKARLLAEFEEARRECRD